MPCIKQKNGEKFTLYNGDCYEILKDMPDNCFDFGIHSPPFSNLYIYSDSYRDMGNCANDDEFFTQYDFVIEQLFRTTKPGRLCAVHCKQLVNYKGRDGEAGLRDFRGEIIRHFQKYGWVYHSEVCIWKDPVVEQQRTKCQGLLHCQIVRDSSKSRQGLPDYLVVMRKPGENETPITNCFDDYYGDTKEPDRSKYTTDTDTRNWYSIEVWQRYASPVWFDIRQTNVLNVKFAKGKEDEKHICPLQLDVIARAVELWSNPGETVFTPFAGIGSELVVPIEMNRYAVGCELKEEYFEIAVANCIEREQNTEITLFDMEM